MRAPRHPPPPPRLTRVAVCRRCSQCRTKQAAPQQVPRWRRRSGRFHCCGQKEGALEEGGPVDARFLGRVDEDHAGRDTVRRRDVSRRRLGCERGPVARCEMHLRWACIHTCHMWRGRWMEEHCRTDGGGSRASRRAQPSAGLSGAWPEPSLCGHGWGEGRGACA